VGYDITAADDVMATGFNWCPPLAMYQALSQVSEIPLLIKERLTEVFDQVDIERLFKDIKPSKYDYRKYFKSGRKGK
jgi:3-hydroxyacyl-CoA dehydrogenase